MYFKTYFKYIYLYWPKAPRLLMNFILVSYFSFKTLKQSFFNVDSVHCNRVEEPASLATTVFIDEGGLHCIGLTHSNNINFGEYQTPR